MQILCVEKIETRAKKQIRYLKRVSELFYVIIAEEFFSPVYASSQQS